jgi:hypothetical protein
VTPELQELIDEANDSLALHDCEPLDGEQVECLLDPTREDEACDMVDDLEARCGLLFTVADALREWIADRHNINARG